MDFEQQANVAIVEGDISHTPCDAVVSPANSFGFMDGGLDLALSERFGWDLQERLQADIRERYDGELLVGQAHVNETRDPDVPWLISAPPMRVSMEIRTSISAYLAMRAILSAVRSHNVQPPIETVAVPVLGTVVGKLAFDIAALQMWTAYEEVMLGKRFCPGDLGDAIDRHLKLNPLCRLFS